MSIIEILTILDASLALVSSAGINLAKVQAMRDGNADGRLTRAQLEELAAEAQRQIDRLPDGE